MAVLRAVIGHTEFSTCISFVSVSFLQFTRSYVNYAFISLIKRFKSIKMSFIVFKTKEKHRKKDLQGCANWKTLILFPRKLMMSSALLSGLVNSEVSLSHRNTASKQGLNPTQMVPE